MERKPGTKILFLRLSALKDLPVAEALSNLRKQCEYLDNFPDDLLEAEFTMWKERGKYLLRAGVELETLLYCQPDGLKTLLVRTGDDVLIALLRSKLEDIRYQRQLVSYFSADAERLRQTFLKVPTFGSGTVSDMITALEKCGGRGASKKAKQEILQLASWYVSVPDETQTQMHAMDIRVFSSMQALRAALCHLSLKCLVVMRAKDTSHFEGLTRLYAYRTDEAIPRRPPIYASCATKQHWDIIGRARELSGKTIYAKQSFVYAAAHIEKSSAGRDQIHVIALNLPDSYCRALLELSFVRDLEDVDIAREAMEAALWETDDRAINSLQRRATLATPRQVRDFGRLLFVFARGLTCSRQAFCEASLLWQKALDLLRRELASVHPGSFSLRSRDRLEGVLQVLLSGGDRRRFNFDDFSSALAALRESLQAPRLGVGFSSAPQMA